MNSPFALGNKIYDFMSNDEVWIVSLARDFLALTSQSYERWEQFREHLKNALEALIEVYSPDSLLRVGLRYQNVIRRSELGLNGTKWAELLKSYIAGELAAPETDVTESIQEVVKQVLIQLPDSRSQVRLQHGLLLDDNKEICYLIDNDFFTEQKTEIKDALDILETFNKQNRYLFQWCITEKLHQAMDPE